MKLYEIPDIRLFWSKDSGFLNQFATLKPDELVKYVPISAHPQLYMDLSFWLPDGVSSENMRSDAMDVIRTMGGNLVEQVQLMDEYVNKKTGKLSQCYRIVYRSMEGPLTSDRVNVIHKSIEKNLEERFGAKIR